jgi:hypothetical protein
MRMRWICLLVAGLLWAGNAAEAKPAFGALVDQKCTANGWVPARPYNPNNLATTDPTKVNCALCHTNPLGAPLFPSRCGIAREGLKLS